jgi:GNAT superfamily N-acetyltransferase
MGPEQLPVGAVLVRSAWPGDREAVAALFAAAGRSPADALSAPGRCIAAVAGPPERVIGAGAWWPVRPGKFRMDLLVAAGWRRRGTGSGLLGHLAGRARAAGAATLQARADSDDQESLGFLVARGFAETMRMHRQELDVAGADLSPREHILARLAGQGIVLVPLEDELARGQACWEEFCRFFNAAREGWPDPDPGPVPPLTPSEFPRRHQAAAEEHGVGTWECFLAVRGDRYVGFTGALGTAVDPAFRGQGIATALKRRAVISARDHGVATLSTSTGNPAMARVNQRLGFRLVSTEIRLVRTLQTPHDAR